MIEKAKRLILNIFVLSMAIILSLSMFACGPEGEGGGNEPVITLSATEKTLDIYESFTLTVTTENLDGVTVVWSSSDPTVASVDQNGKVKASNIEGNTTITATAGEVSATCSVIVENSHSIPALILSADEVENVEPNGSFEISATTTYNGNVVSGLTYNWSVDKEGIVEITPSADGSTVTVKGLAFGSVNLTCLSICEGNPNTSVVKVNVFNPNVSFEVEGLTAGSNGYSVPLTLFDDEDYDKEYAPVITVSDGTNIINNSEIVWSSDDEDIAIVENGVIKAKALGNARILAFYNDNGIYFDVNVTRAEYAINEFEYLEVAEDNGIDRNSVIQGEVESVLYNGFELFREEAGGKIHLNEKAVEKIGLGNVANAIEVYTDKAKYTYDNVEFIAMEIDNKEEFDRMDEVALSLGNQDTVSPTMAGIFYLNADIDYNGVYTPNAMNVVADHSGGFVGKFDGRGHVISGLKIENDGYIFAGIMGSAEFKNVTFLNSEMDATATTGTGAFLAKMNDGFVENLFVHLSKVTVKNNNVMLLGQANHGSAKAYNNVIVVIEEVVKDATATETRTVQTIGARNFLAPFTNTIGIAPNVTGVYVNKAGTCENDGNGNAVNWRTILNDYNALTAMNEDIDDGWDTEFWHEFDGVILPKTVSLLSEQTEEMGDNTAGIALWKAYKNDVEGVDKSTYKSGYTFAENLVIDLTANEFDSVKQAVINGVDYSANFDNNALTIAKSAVTARGEVSLFIVATKDGNTVSAIKPLLLADILISTADDFEAMQWLADPYAEDTNTWCASIKSANMAGYIALTNDIEYNRQYKVHQNSAAFTATAGFSGVLDGRGYTVDGLEMVEQLNATNGYPTNYGGFSSEKAWGAGSGIFSTMLGGTIKNIAFTNAVQSCGGGFITSHMKNGNTIENVYIHIKSAEGYDLSSVAANNKQYAASAIFNTHSHAGGVTIKDVVAVVDYAKADYYVGCFWGNSIGTGMQNVFVVSGSDKVLISHAGEETSTHAGLTVYNTISAVKDDKTAWSALPAKYFDTTGDLPVFNGNEIAVPEIELPAAASVAAGEVVAVKVNALYQTIEVTGKGSYANGKVTVDSDAVLGDIVEITITDILSGESESVTLTVSETINVSTVTDVEMSDNSEGIASFVAYKTNVEEVTGFTYKSDYSFVANYSYDLTEYALDTITDALVGEVNVLATSTKDALAFAKADITARGEVKAVVKGTKNGGEVVINIPFFFADILISTADDFEAMQWLADKLAVDDTSFTHYGQISTMGGYIALTQNINYNRTYKVHPGTIALDARYVGFIGTLDGRGYAVDGIEMVEQTNANNTYGSTFMGYSSGPASAATSGIFGIISKGAVIKNIAFTNAVHTCGGGFITTSASHGGNVIENVYLHIKSANGTTYVPGAWNEFDVSGAINGQDHSGNYTIRNTVVVIDKVEKNYYSFGSFTTPGGSMAGVNNVYIITTNAKLMAQQNPGTTMPELNEFAGVTKYNDIAALKAGKDAWANLPASVWDTTGDVPVFKGMTFTAPAIIVPDDASLTAGAIVTVNFNKMYQTIAVEGNATLSGNTVTINADAQGGDKVTVTVTDMLTGNSDSVTYTVVATENVTLNKVVDFELSRSTVTTFDINLEGQLSKGDLAKVTLVNGNDETVFTADDYTLDGNTLKVKVSAIGATNFGKDLTVKVYLEKKDGDVVTNYTIISAPFSTVSMVIKNADDLDSLQALADPLYDNEGDGGKYINYGGYFVLGNNIDYTGHAYATVAGVNDPNTYSGGFRGTFDGRGFNIDKFSYAEGNTITGLFARNLGTIKNVSFTNATFKSFAWGNGFIATHQSGTLENIYAHFTAVDASVQRAWIFGSQSFINTQKTINCFAVIDSKVGTSATRVVSQDSGVITNAYSIGAITDSHVGGSVTVTNKGFYATASAAKGNIVTTGWDDSFWTIVNGLPYPKKLTAPTVTLTAPAGGDIAAGGTITCDTGIYGIVSAEGNATVTGNTVTVKSDAQAGDVITVTVTNAFNPENKVSANYTVMATINANLSYVEMSDNTQGIASFNTYKGTNEYKTDYTFNPNYSVDLTSYGLDEITSASVGEVDVLATSSKDALVFAKSAVSARGDVKAVVNGTKNGGKVVINIPLVLADILVSTADDFEAMQWLADMYADDVASAAGITVMKSAGYIALTNNIAYNRTYKVHERTYVASIDNDGFGGTLDGRGFTVDGLEMAEQTNAANNYTNIYSLGYTTSVGSVAGSGIFGVIGTNATIKNIAFTNAKHSCGGGFITTTARGGGNVIENVYVHITQALGTEHTAGQWTYQNASGVLNGQYHGGGYTVRNIFIKVDAVTTGVYYTLGCFTNPGPIANNIFIVSSHGSLLNRANPWSATDFGVSTSYNGVTKYADATAATAGKAAWSAGLTSSVWDTTGDLPVFASTKAN